MKFDLCETCINTLYQGGAFGPCGACVDGNNYEQKRELLAAPTVLGVDLAPAVSAIRETIDAAFMLDLGVPEVAVAPDHPYPNDYLCTYLGEAAAGPLALLTDPQARKNTPITTGVLDYFPDAIAAVAQCSKAGNDQHNPGQPLHWAREKSTDHADCISRHLIQRGTFDSDGIRHSAKLAWRALANLQVEIEEERNVA